MSDAVETICVVRKDHPDGFTEINKSDMTEKDVEYEAPAPKKSAKKSADK